MSDNLQNIEHEASRSAEWGERGEKALENTFENLLDVDQKLKSASDLYLHRPMGDKDVYPGVFSTFDVYIKDHLDHYTYTTPDNDAVKHMVETNTKLVQNVEAQLSFIQRLEDGTNHRDLEEKFENASHLLKELLSTSKPEDFDRVSRELSETVEKGINVVNKGATSGQTASSEITSLSENEYNNFEDWWKNNYNDEYSQTMTDFKNSLGLFWETARAKARNYQDVTKYVLSVVKEDMGKPVADFINDYRNQKFPKTYTGVIS